MASKKNRKKVKKVLPKHWKFDLKVLADEMAPKKIEKSG